MKNEIRSWQTQGFLNLGLFFGEGYVFISMHYWGNENLLIIKFLEDLSKNIFKLFFIIDIFSYIMVHKNVDDFI